MYTRKKKQKRNDNTNYRFPRSRETTSLSAASFSSFFKSNEERQVTRLRKKNSLWKVIFGNDNEMATFSNLQFGIRVPFSSFLCVCAFPKQKQKTSQLNRFVLSSADGHDAKTLRVHQRVVWPMTWTLYFPTIKCVFVGLYTHATNQTHAQNPYWKFNKKKLVQKQ